MRLLIVRHGDPDYEKDSLTANIIGQSNPTGT